jgi:hypothetical protein
MSREHEQDHVKNQEKMRESFQGVFVEGRRAQGL